MDNLTKEEIDNLKKSAEQGDATLQYNLALCYDNGEGVEQDYEKAVYWYTKAAEQGYADAQNNLGNCYHKGKGVEQNDEKSLYWLTKSAEQENVYAQFNLGYCYYIGQGVEQNYKNAVYWYIKSAEQGLKEAQFNLGNAYYNGEGVEQDYKQALYWWTKAAKQGLVIAQKNLGFCYQDGEIVEQNNKQAATWYRKAAEQGDADAQYNLSYFYDNGQGVKQNYKKAFYWCKKAAMQNHPKAQNTLGVYYSAGYGVKENDKKAIYWYTKSAKQGDVVALHNIAFCYKYGTGIEKNYEKSAYLLEKLAKNESSVAQYDLAMMYYDGEGVEVDLKKAKELFEQANNNGYKCEYILNIVKNELGETDGETGMKEYAKELSSKNLTFKQLDYQVGEDLKNDFGDTWNKLNKKTKTFLHTGLYDYFTIYGLGEEIYRDRDFSGSVISMTKALENELKIYFFEGYICYLKQKNIDPNMFNEKKVFIRKESGELLYRNINDGDLFSLGALKFLVGVENREKIDFDIKVLKEKEEFATRHTVNGKNTYTVDATILDYFDEIIKKDNSFERKELTMYLVDLCNEVTSISDSFRNKSAHTTMITCGMANVCADYLIKVKKLIKNFVDMIDMDRFNEILNGKHDG